MKEYKLLISRRDDIQKLLNQWRHEYIIEVLGMSCVYSEIDATVVASVLVARERRQDK